MPLPMVQQLVSYSCCTHKLRIYLMYREMLQSPVLLYPAGTLYMLVEIAGVPVLPEAGPVPPPRKSSLMSTGVSFLGHLKEAVPQKAASIFSRHAETPPTLVTSSETDMVPHTVSEPLVSRSISKPVIESSRLFVVVPITADGVRGVIVNNRMVSHHLITAYEEGIRGAMKFLSMNGAC